MSTGSKKPDDCGLQTADGGLAPRVSFNPPSAIQNPQWEDILQRIYAADVPDVADIEAVLRAAEPAGLFDFAEGVRRDFVGDGVLLRGLIEFSNVCRNTCMYCGLNRGNHALRRYRLSRDEILTAVGNIRRAGLRTVVLQSGEEAGLDAGWLREIIREVRREGDMAVTLSVGERTRREYASWREAGADRYLLKIETSDPGLYESLHPGMSFENRLRCLRDLAELGYQTGTGNLVGLRGQTIETLAGDILFFRRGDYDMLSVSPFIPHPQTPLAQEPAGDLMLTLKMIALTRIVSRDAHIPASTAIGSLHGRDERAKALAAGANVLMPNFTPAPYGSQYEIYPNRRCTGDCIGWARHMAAAAGRHVDTSRGDSFKHKDLKLCRPDGQMSPSRRRDEGTRQQVSTRTTGEANDGEQGADDR